jgi:hypothetical protein
MKTRPVRIVSSLSSALFVLAVIAWSVSHVNGLKWYVQRLSHNTPGDVSFPGHYPQPATLLGLDPGRIKIRRYQVLDQYSSEGLHFGVWGDPLENRRLTPGARERVWEVGGLEDSWQELMAIPEPIGRKRPRIFGPSLSNVRTISIPLWPIVIMTAILPAISLRNIRLQRKRILYGLCLNCGYDLRKTGRRCSECGATKVGTKYVGRVRA